MKAFLPLAVLLCVAPALAPPALAQEAFSSAEVSVFSAFMVRSPDVRIPPHTNVSGGQGVVVMDRQGDHSGWFTSRRVDLANASQAETIAFRARWESLGTILGEPRLGVMEAVPPVIVLQLIEERPALYDPDWTSRRMEGGVVYASATDDLGVVTVRFLREAAGSAYGAAQAYLYAALTDEVKSRAERDAIRDEMRSIRQDLAWKPSDDEARRLLERLDLLDGRVRALADEGPEDVASTERATLPAAWADALAKRREGMHARSAQWAQELARDREDLEAEVYAARARAESDRELSLASMGLLLTGVGLVASVLAGLPEAVKSWRAFLKVRGTRPRKGTSKRREQPAEAEPALE